MTLSFKPDHQYYVLLHKFVVSQSVVFINNLRRGRYIITVIYLAFILYLLYAERYIIVGIFFILALISFFGYPWFYKRKFEKYYRAYVNKHYAERIGETISYEIEPDEIIVKDHKGSSVLHTSDIQIVYEIPEGYVLRLNKGIHILLPLESFPDTDHFQDLLLVWKNAYHTQYLNKSHWQW